MSTETVFVPFNEYNSTINRYSDGNIKREKEYKGIIESETGQAIYERQNPSFGAHADLDLYANVPVKNILKKEVKIEDQNVPIYKEFWQYKQPAGTIFTDWTSAGISHIREDISVRNLELFGKIKDPSLVLSNTNNVRNNFQRYGKEYLTTTNMLNAEAFSNGVSYSNDGKGPYRNSTKDVLNQMIHGSFENSEYGDTVTRNENVLRVDLPGNYANSTVSSWQKTLAAFITPNIYLKEHDRERQKFGTFSLDAMKLTGKSCLTKDFGVIPKNYNHAADVYNDLGNFPPVTNPKYYDPKSKDFLNQEGDGIGLYCSANTNYVTMPINPLHKNLDTSFQVAAGNNSITLGAIMSPKLKEFINSDLHTYNRDFIFMNLYENQLVQQFHDHPGTNIKTVPKTRLMKHIENLAPSLFTNGTFTYYSSLSEKQKYTYVFNIQRNLITLQQGNPELENFINNLSIVKIGGHSRNPNIFGQVLCSELSESPIKILGKGSFLLLPTMLSDDLFTVPSGGNCITPGSNYAENATNCAFRGHANMWQQKPEPGLADPTFVPNMFDDTENPNNFLYNLSNPYGVGNNFYNAPLTF
jgi:hypothetical protein